MAEPIWNLTTREHNVTTPVTTLGQELFNSKEKKVHMHHKNKK